MHNFNAFVINVTCLNRISLHEDNLLTNWRKKIEGKFCQNGEKYCYTRVFRSVVATDFGTHRLPSKSINHRIYFIKTTDFIWIRDVWCIEHVFFFIYICKQYCTALTYEKQQIYKSPFLFPKENWFYLGPQCMY